MQELVREYLNDLGKKHKKRRRFRIVSVLFALIVVGGVIWGLARAGIATTGEPRCGREEHQHTDACYSDVLNCGMEESSGHTHTDDCYQTAEPELICVMEESEEHAHTDECYQTAEPALICGQEEYEGHTHTDVCYTKQLSCGKEEHQHEDDCYIDKSADVEDASKWNAQYEGIEWENAWGKDLVTAAKLQLDYKESVANYAVAEDGSHKGYTRYGQFNGDPYADWDAAFVNFCMYYAGLTSSEMFPGERGTQEWYDKFIKDDEGKKKVYLTTPDGYEPQEGDLIFLKKENEETKFQMGIVSSYNKEDKEKNEIKVIEGNSENQVKENTYKIDDEHISEYLKITEMEKDYKEAQKQPAEDGTDTQAPEEKTIELTTEVDGVTITLFGPESSFEADKEYTIQAEKVENKEVLATVEEAVEQMAEEQEKKVENFQPYDIKLLLDGEEVQPLGPVSVKFSGKEVVKSVENEETEVSVIHVDENTGEATDMGAVATEEKDVVIETEHFSVYVYVHLADIYDTVTVVTEHWGQNITTINGKADASEGTDTVFDKNAVKVKVNKAGDAGKFKLYSKDTVTIPNEYYSDIEKLSKVCNVDKEQDEKQHYRIAKVWVSNDPRNMDRENEKSWYKEPALDQNSAYTGYQSYEYDDVKREIKDLKTGSVIRFWYEPITEDEKKPAKFYDYDMSDGKYYNQNGTDSIGERTKDYKWLKTDNQGTNATDNLTTDKESTLLIGQHASGNRSEQAGSQYKGKNLNAGNGFVKGNVADIQKVASVVENIVQSDLTDDDDLVFNVNAPKNLFSGNAIDYDLNFTREGDTYTLKGVDNGIPDQDLTKFTKYNDKVYANNFWALDNVKGIDPKLNPSTNYYKILPDSELSPSDDGQSHNWYFGMVYEVEFKIGDYTGPMEYYFRGDDDFWLFIDGKKVVDLGGIHLAVGESLDVREYLEGVEGTTNLDKTKTHTMKIFYMERGGFGSCCYMQFTLPNSRLVELPDPETTTYQVTKNWDDVANPFRPESIKVRLLQDGEKTNEIVELTEENNWTYTWEKLPKINGSTSQKLEYTYEVEEVELPPGYSCYRVDEDGNKVIDITNTIVTDENGNEVVTGILKNHLDYVSIDVSKEWENDDGTVVQYRPDSVQIQLYVTDKDNKEVPYEDKNGNPKIITLTKGGNWKGTFDQLPEYWNYEWYQEVQKDEDGNPMQDEDGNPLYGPWKCKADKIKYSVRELDQNKKPVENGDTMSGKEGAKYKVTYSGKVEIDDDTGKASLSVTNTLLTKFRIIKKNSEGNLNLEGAEFTLTPYDPSGENTQDITETLGTANLTGEPDIVLETDSQLNKQENAHFNKPKYQGISNKQGLVEWYEWQEDEEGKDILSQDKKATLAKGDYILREVKAPLGYELSAEKWIVSIRESGRASIIKINGTTTETLDPVYDPSGSEVIFEFTFHDEALYELPSTGGPGIYWYMFSGMLLMAAASLITYRNKREEVLRS